MDKLKKEIKYIGFYDLPGSKYKRVSTLAATNKMDYICDAINRAGFNVQIVSPSWFDDDASKAKFQLQTTMQLSEQKKITFCPSFGTKIMWVRNLKIVLSLLWLFFWLIKHVKRDEKILVYHVQWLSLPIRWAKKIKSFKLILEVEEIYGQVWKNKEYFKKWERKLLQSSDFYIAVSEVLAEILGTKVKAIIYGNYTVSETDSCPVYSNIINVVYAGSIEDIKGGALNAAKCARYLPQNFIVHICGPGKADAVFNLEQEILLINNELAREACVFHGIMPDNIFSNFLHSCQIAINPQKEGENMTTLFPSKIIKYLAHNLRVVSTRIKSIDKSTIAKLITFSENDTPYSFAKAILQLDLGSKYDSREVIRQLDKKFVQEIIDLFGIK